MKKWFKMSGLLFLAAWTPLTMAGEVKKPDKTAYPNDFAKAIELATKENKPLLIDFYTDWCTWCKKFDTEVLIDPKTVALFKNDVVYAYINAEVDTVVSKEFKIMGYPTFVLANSKGEEIDRIAGYMPTDEFLKTVNDYRNGIGTLPTMLKSAEGSTDRNLFFQIADKYKYRGNTEVARSWYDKIIAAGGKQDSLSGEALMSVADMYRRDKKNDLAMVVSQQVVTDFAGTQFEGRGMLYVGHLHRWAKEFEDALNNYKQVMAKFKGSDMEEEAEIYSAIAYRDKGDTTQAIAAFLSFTEHWPKSEDIAYANDEIRKLRGE